MCSCTPVHVYMQCIVVQLYMSICMLAHVYMYMCKCVRVYACISIGICIVGHAVRVWKSREDHMRTHVYIYMYISMYVYMNICIYVYMYMCIHIYLYICTCVYVYVYFGMQCV